MWEIAQLPSVEDHVFKRLVLSDPFEFTVIQDKEKQKILTFEMLKND